MVQSCYKTIRFKNVYSWRVVSSAAVIWFVTQRFSLGENNGCGERELEALRDDPNNGCGGDYMERNSKKKSCTGITLNCPDELKEITLLYTFLSV